LHFKPEKTELHYMKVVITAATEKEISQIKDTLDPLYTGESTRLKVFFHNSGVGLLQSCFSITKLIFEQKPDLIIQAGIAGALDHKLALSKVVVVREEQLADTGCRRKWHFQRYF
jgi:futalosine hydrolase